MRHEEEQEYMVDPEEARRIEREVRREVRKEALGQQAKGAAEILRLALSGVLWLTVASTMYYGYVLLDPFGTGARKEARQVEQLQAEREQALQQMREATPWRLTREGYYAAVLLPNLRNALAVSAAGDDAALRKLFDGGLVLTTRGKVRVQIMEREDGYTCIRPEGQTGCLWVEEAGLDLEP